MSKIAKLKLFRYLDIFSWSRNLWSDDFFQGFFVVVERLLTSFVAFILANICPGIFDVWHCAIVDCTHIGITKSHDHFTVELLSVQCFRLDSVEDLLSQLKDLFEEFRSQIIKFHLIEFLQILFINKRSDKGHAFTLLEESG